ncbi:MAG TPA: hypothetical protein VHW44_29575 [Pseudonocardiaceae bacterium]|jgi:hypothetical protein|nr:hypothetical protein [Pseudonocardiaceae bacterium]
MADEPDRDGWLSAVPLARSEVHQVTDMIVARPDAGAEVALARPRSPPSSPSTGPPATWWTARRAAPNRIRPEPSTEEFR